MERVKEVMVHVTGSKLRGNENSSSDEPLMRPQDQIEADVKRVISQIPEITGIFFFFFFLFNLYFLNFVFFFLYFSLVRWGNSNFLS